MIIYLITNKINGKKYVGQTVQSLKERFKQHCYRNKRSCTVLHHAIKKYGRNNFMVEQIDTATTRDELDRKEIYWIEYYNSLAPNGYNLHTGGIHHETSEETKERMRIANTGRKHTKETKERIRQANKGRVFTEEHRRKIKENHARLSGEKASFYGRKHTDEAKRRISEAHSGEKHPLWGKHLPEETRRKISEANTGKKRSAETCRKISEARTGKSLTDKQREGYKKRVLKVSRKVMCVELNKKFNSVKEAGEFLNMYPCNISRVCGSERKTCGGYHWQYIN